MFSKFGVDEIDRLTTILSELESSLKMAVSLANLEADENFSGW